MLNTCSKHNKSYYPFGDRLTEQLHPLGHVLLTVGTELQRRSLCPNDLKGMRTLCAVWSTAASTVFSSVEKWRFVFQLTVLVNCKSLLFLSISSSQIFIRTVLVTILYFIAHRSCDWLICMVRQWLREWICSGAGNVFYGQNTVSLTLSCSINGWQLKLWLWIKLCSPVVRSLISLMNRCWEEALSDSWTLPHSDWQ